MEDQEVTKLKEEAVQLIFELLKKSQGMSDTVLRLIATLFVETFEGRLVP
jgi:hypothetical protein